MPNTPGNLNNEQAGQAEMSNTARYSDQGNEIKQLSIYSASWSKRHNYEI